MGKFTFIDKEILASNTIFDSNQTCRILKGFNCFVLWCFLTGQLGHGLYVLSKLDISFDKAVRL